jgi:diaminopropionate ammonia-lyase
MPSGFVHQPTHAPRNLFDAREFEHQRTFFAQQHAFAPTPLHHCAGLARDLGLGQLLVKDETARYGLSAFKAVGAAFAIATLKQRGDIQPGNTLVCASEGNHGRAVARVAREARCRARVYMSRAVAAARVAAIQSEGAEVTLVDGTYDEAVRVMAREARAHGWTVISDTSWPGYSEIPRLIMLGYTRLMDEDWTPSAGADGLQTGRPDVIFVPAGVGGLLAAVACWCDARYGADRPCVVSVEPISAACVQVSVQHGRPTTLPGPFDTTMGGLRCGEMSADVFPVVDTLVDAFVGIEDDFAFEAMRRLARPREGDPPVICGPSGGAALGGLIATLRHPALHEIRQYLGLDAHSRVQVLVTEGATDPALVDEILARP